jgi:hypothetical protein
MKNNSKKIREFFAGQKSVVWRDAPDYIARRQAEGDTRNDYYGSQGIVLTIWITMNGIN